MLVIYGENIYRVHLLAHKHAYCDLYQVPESWTLFTNFRSFIYIMKTRDVIINLFVC